MVQTHAKKLVSSALFCLLGYYAVAQNEAPLIGNTMTVRTTICKIDVTSKGRNRIDNIYSAPKSWQILTFKPVVIANTEKATYAFSPTPVCFAISSASAIYSKFIELFELAAEKNVYEKYQGKITRMRTDFEKYSKNDTPLYSSIKITGAVKKNNFVKSKTRRLYVDLMITLVYMPASQEGVLQSLEYVRQLINEED